MDIIPIWVFFIAAAVIGLEFGGLASIFIQRWIDELPILKPGRSMCPSCEHRLTLLDTIPVLSYVMLKGRCRHCGQSIGGQYMLVEISCLAWSLALAYQFGLSLEWGVYLVLGCMLIAGSFIDFETFLLPNRVTIGGAVLALAASLVLGEGPGWQNAVLGSLVGGGLFWVMQQGYRLWRKEEGLGTGDVKLMFMIGAITGFSGLPFTMMAGAITGSMGSAIYMARSGKGMKTRIPFGPFLSLGCMFYVLYGQDIMHWWVSH
ncbi:MAG: prepilin peptidase [Pseudodesulfovibrio sp.]|nr:prepilin peptidase [Pseudodesulfovibrio sp.]